MCHALTNIAAETALPLAIQFRASEALPITVMATVPPLAGSCGKCCVYDSRLSAQQQGFEDHPRVCTHHEQTRRRFGRGKRGHCAALGRGVSPCATHSSQLSVVTLGSSGSHGHVATVSDPAQTWCPMNGLVNSHYLKTRRPGQTAPDRRGRPSTCIHDLGESRSVVIGCHCWLTIMGFHHSAGYCCTYPGHCPGAGWQFIAWHPKDAANGQRDEPHCMVAAYVYGVGHLHRLACV